MSRSKKSKSAPSLTEKLPLAIKTGDVRIGYRTVIKSLIEGKSKLLVIASNFPKVQRKLIEYYAELNGSVPINFIKGNNNELAKISDKFFRVGVLSVIDPGEVDINMMIPTKVETD
ncbi:60S ribosomal protein L30 [Dictyocoela muelleri]|nr:60S ribosomal protein L30 [Dictyocoela muelleri]